jgi:hypothetical protein
LKKPRTVVLLGADLASAKEEAFCLMVMDGLAIGAAFVKAGFTSKAADAPYALFRKPHIQARAKAILEARRTQFAGALHDAEYSAAHNAAFSLARIYGHVTDRATIEVIRRPSRDPDAPSEQALASWVEALPALAGPGLEAPDMAPFMGLEGPGPGPDMASQAPLSSAPAGPLGPDPIYLNDIKGPGPDRYQPTAGPGPQGPELCNDIKGLGLDGVGVRGRTENGAPSGPVTGTPHSGARAGLLGPEGPGGIEKGAPLQDRQVPAIPSAEELFG